MDKRNKLRLWLGLSFLAAIFGRLGGTSAGTKWRDIGVSACICAILALAGGKLGLWGYLSLIPTFFLQWAALTTYRYFLPKPKDYTWPYYALHGFMVSFAAIFFAWATGCWLGFGARCVINAVLVGLWSHFISKDWLEESGRYFFITATSPIITFI